MKFKTGFYSANYFLKAKKILKTKRDTCEMQFTHFSKTPIMVAGIDESIKIIKKSIPFYFFKKIKVYAQPEGAIITNNQPAIVIFGKYKHFAHVENLIDGILARRSSVATNCYELLRAAPAEKIIYMADRADDYRMQPFDGYCAHLAGIRNFVTKASVSLIKDKTAVQVTGTMPHALIQQHGGNLLETIKSYVKTFGDSKVVALVDYNNDVISEIKSLSNNVKKLWAIRIDTSNSLFDISLSPSDKGVCPKLLFKARKALDDFGFSSTKIIISSNLTKEKINNFEKEKLPIDFYGIGSALIERKIHFTADLVILNNKPQSKFGRRALYSNEQLKKMKRYI